MSIDHLINPIASYDPSCNLEPLQISFNIDLFIDTYKDAPHCGVTVLARVLHTCIMCDTPFLFELEIAKQPLFDLGSPGLQVAMLTIELHSIDSFLAILTKYVL